MSRPTRRAFEQPILTENEAIRIEREAKNVMNQELEFTIVYRIDVADANISEVLETLREQGAAEVINAVLVPKQ